MIRTKFTTINFLIIFLVFTGCAIFQTEKSKITELSEINTEKKARLPQQPFNSYYYFIKAQLQKKKGYFAQAIELLNKAIIADPESVFLKRELATLYLHKKNDEKALYILQDLVEKEPVDLRALILYGRINQSRKNYDKAIEAYEKVISLDPEQRNIYLLLGSLYLEKKQLDKAEKIYNKLINYFPASYVGHFFMGKIMVMQGKMDQAEIEFKRTLELEPKLEEPRFELLKIYQLQSKKNLTTRMFEELLDENPANIRAGLGFALHLYKLGRFEDSEKRLKQMGRQTLVDQEIIRRMVEVYLDKKLYADGVILLKGMLKGAPDSSDLQYVIGVAYNNLNENTLAIEHLQRVKPESRFYETAVVHAASLYQEQKKIAQGISFLQKQIKQKPGIIQFHLYLGNLYEELEDFAKAEQAINRGLAVDPKNAHLYFRLGVVYDKWGKKEKSIKSMRTVIKLDPKNANALNYLGYTYADMGQNLDEAESLIIRALENKPDDGYIIDSLGWVFYKKEKFSKALELLLKAHKLVPDDPTVLEHLGDVYLKLENKQKAVEHYERSLKIKKTDKEKIIQKIKVLKDQNAD